MASKRLLPTPVTRNSITGSRSVTPFLANKIKDGWTVELNDLATLGLLPTPDDTPIDHSKGQLSPCYVAEMMGYDPMYVLAPFIKKPED